MGLRTFISRVCLVAVFFISGISSLSNLPLARSQLETDLKAYEVNSDSHTSALLGLLQQNSYTLVTLWSCLAVVCSIATVLKVKWSAWVLVLMLGTEAVTAWYSPVGTAALLKALSMTGGLLIMISSVQQPGRKPSARVLVSAQPSS